MKMTNPEPPFVWACKGCIPRRTPRKALGSLVDRACYVCRQDTEFCELNYISRETAEELKNIQAAPKVFAWVCRNCLGSPCEVLTFARFDPGSCYVCNQDTPGVDLSYIRREAADKLSPQPIPESSLVWACSSCIPPAVLICDMAKEGSGDCHVCYRDTPAKDLNYISRETGNELRLATK